jgi:hypothetical protein
LCLFLDPCRLIIDGYSSSNSVFPIPCILFMCRPKLSRLFVGLNEVHQLCGHSYITGFSKIFIFRFNFFAIFTFAFLVCWWFPLPLIIWHFVRNSNVICEAFFVQKFPDFALLGTKLASKFRFCRFVVPSFVSIPVIQIDRFIITIWM